METDKECIILSEEQLRINSLNKVKYAAKYATKAIDDFNKAYSELPEDLKKLIKE